MRSPIAKLRKTLPEYLRCEEYCALRERSRASAFSDLRRVSGLGVKIGSSTFFVRDVALDEMAREQAPRPWVPQKDCAAAPAKDATSKKSPRSQRQRKRAVEVQA